MARPLDIATPLGDGTFVALEFSGREHLSRLSAFVVRQQDKWQTSGLTECWAST